MLKRISLLFLIFQLSCSTEVSKYDEQILLCLSEIEEPLDFRENCNDAPPEGICERIHKGKFFFTEEAKLKFPDFCLNVGESISLSDSLGNVELLEVVDKNYSQSNYRLLKQECSNNEEFVEYCCNSESANLVLEGEISSFTINMNSFLVRNDPSKKGIWLRTISSFEEGNAITFEKLIDNYDFYEIPEFEGYHLLDSLNINGISYSNIHSYFKATANEDKEIMYFLEDFTLLGFEDKNQTRWIRKF